jgi:hypothetical protein
VKRAAELGLKRARAEVKRLSQGQTP